MKCIDSFKLNQDRQETEETHNLTPLEAPVTNIHSAQTLGNKQVADIFGIVPEGRRDLTESDAEDAEFQEDETPYKR